VNAPVVAKPKRKNANKPFTLSKIRASQEAIRLAAAILEVLAGARSTTAAAEALGVSQPRYYSLEARAVEGLVRACEPRKKGRQKTNAKELEQLKRENSRLERECARSQALLRMAQKAAGFAPPPPRPEKKGSKQRKLRPHTRALVAVEALKKHNEPIVAPPAPPAEGAR
jgi:hypothetical protein